MARRLSKRLTQQEWQERFKEGELEKYEITHTFMHGSTFDKVTDLLAFPSYLSGGYAIEKEKQLKEARETYANDPRELAHAEANIRMEFASPLFAGLQALGNPQLRQAVTYSVKHRVEPSRVYDDGFVAGMGRNIGSDPTAFITGGAAMVRRGGGAVLRRLPHFAQKPIVYATTKVATEKAALRGAASGVRNAAMLKAKGAVVWAGGKAMEGASAAGRTARRMRDVAGEAFEVGYKFKQLGAKYKQFHETWEQMVVSRRGATTQALWEIRQLGKPYKRAGADAMEYVERGVSTGVEEFDRYLDNVVKPYIDDMRATEIAAGYDIGEIVNYAPHVFTKRGQELLNKLGSEDAVIKYFRDKAGIGYGKERTLEGSARKINEMLGDKVFVEDLWEALAVRAQKSASDLATTGWLKEVQQKFGAQESDTVIEQVLTSGARAVPGKMRKFQILSAALTGKIDDIIGSKSTGSLLTGELHAAKKSGVFSATPFKGQAAAWTSRITDIAEYAKQLTRARTGVKTHTQELSKIDTHVTEELSRGGARVGSRISRDTLETFDRMYQSTLAGAGRADDMIVIAEARLRGEAMGLQTEIVDPLNRYISSLGKQARETKSVRVVREATDDLSEYTLSKHPDVTTKLPKTMSEFLDTMDEIRPVSSVLERTGKAHDRVLRLWKKTVTTGYGIAVNTAFFGRNVFTGMEQNIQQIGALRTMRGIYNAARLATGRGTFKTAAGEVSAEAMERMMRESGQMGSTGMLDIAADETLYPSAFRRLWNAPERFMQWTESMVREPLFLERIREMTVAGTAKEVKAAHFDYSPEALTATEHAIKRFGLPFYTFTRFNLSRQVGKLFTAPGSFKKWGLIQREAFRTTGMEEEYERAEDWQKSMYVLPVGDKLMHVPIPQEAINLATTDFYYQLHPGKQLLEIMATWSGWGSYKYKMDRTKYILKGLVFGTQRRQFAKLTDPETTLREKAMINVGLSLYDVAPETVSIEEFEQYRYRIIQPTKEQEFKAWVAAGRPKSFTVMQLGPPRGAIGVQADTIIKAKHWWQKDKITKAPETEFDLAIIDPVIDKLGGGFKLSAQQLKYATQLTGAQRKAYVEWLITNWATWKQAQAGTEPATTAQRYSAWVRSGRPADATDRVYRNAMGAIVGIASFDPKEIGEISDYVNHNVQLSSAAFEWAFIQKDMLPEEWILAEYRKANARYLDARAAQEELKGFDVDQPVDASNVNPTQQFEYSRYRRGRVDYEQELIERALGRGEIQ